MESDSQTLSDAIEFCVDDDDTSQLHSVVQGTNASSALPR